MARYETLTFLYLQFFYLNKKMARTHARVRGKSGSTKPSTTDLSFVTMKKEDVVKKVIELASNDVKSSVIGLTLRDKYAVPSVKKVTGKSISDILIENKLLTDVPEDLTALVVKARALKQHLTHNIRDIHNKRGLILIESKIRRLSTYYKKSGRLSKTWSYN